MKSVKIKYLDSIDQLFKVGQLYIFNNNSEIECVVLCTCTSDILSGVIVAHTDITAIGAKVTGFKSDQYVKFSGTVTLED